MDRRTRSHFVILSPADDEGPRKLCVNALLPAIAALFVRSLSVLRRIGMTEGKSLYFAAVTFKFRIRIRTSPSILWSVASVRPPDFW